VIFPADDLPADDLPVIPDPSSERRASLPIAAEQIFPAPTGVGPEPRLIITLPPDEPRDPVWTGLDVFRLTIMAILAIIVSGLAMLAVVHGATFKARVSRLSALPELLIVAQMVAYLLILGYMYILVTKERGSPRFWKALHWNWPSTIWPYLLIGFAMQVVFVFIERFLPFPKETPFDELLRRHAAIVLIAVFAVTLGPLMEELFFRGFLYPVLARRIGITAGILVSALGFGLMHAAQYGYSWASILLIFLVGVVLGTVRAKKNSVAAGVLVHMGYNGTIALVMFAATDGFRHLEKLSQ
jgi:membrane protease YdiL (CAAX protease family)